MVLKLNNPTWKKCIKSFFVQKSGVQINDFAVVKKGPSHQKKAFFKKKSFQLICADKIFKTVYGNFKINGSRNI